MRRRSDYLIRPLLWMGLIPTILLCYTVGWYAKLAIPQIKLIWIAPMMIPAIFAYRILCHATPFFINEDDILSLKWLRRAEGILVFFGIYACVVALYRETPPTLWTPFLVRYSITPTIVIEFAALTSIFISASQRLRFAIAVLLLQIPTIVLQARMFPEGGFLGKQSWWDFQCGTFYLFADATLGLFCLGMLQTSLSGATYQISRIRNSVIALFAAATLFIQHSEMAKLCTVMIILLFAVSIKTQTPARRLAFTGPLMLAIFAVAVAFGAEIIRFFSVHFMFDAYEFSIGNFDRFGAYKHYLFDAPSIFGVGPGSFSSIYAKTDEAVSGHFAYGYLFEALSETGYIGMALAASSVLCLGVAAFNAHKRYNRIGALGFPLALALMSITSHPIRDIGILYTACLIILIPCDSHV